eukprot:TRINITY_DN47838_c0_g1_i1.p1 TRINITY_DN47838_c0_g1~~TRINITY_DN47838_c0_g1_i1.p1  ORF type:complete len:471 (+),score=190.78 TRINITY_DN47838_c0_g1_i1:90-1415(+)
MLDEGEEQGTEVHRDPLDAALRGGGGAAVVKPPSHPRMAAMEAPEGCQVLSFKVTEPRMTMPEGPVDLAYWVYQICTQTTLPWTRKELKVPHRYSDFQWLRDELVWEHPGVIVAPIPEQDLKGQMEKIVLTNLKLVNYRCRALTKFLTAVGCNPRLQNSPLLKGFCELEGSEWEAFKQARKRERAETGPSKLQQLSQKSKEGWFKMFGKGKDEGGGGSTEGDVSPKGRPDCPLQKRKVLATLMEEALGEARDRIARRIEARRELAKGLAELGQQMVKVGEGEDKIDKNLGQDFRNLAQYSERVGTIEDEQAEFEETRVCELVGFYVGAYTGIKNLTRRLQRYQLSMMTCKDALDSAVAAEGKAKDKAKAQRLTEEKRAEHDKAKEKFEKAHAVFDEEWASFNTKRVFDFKQIQKVFIELQVSFLHQVEQTEHPPVVDPEFD